MSLRRGMVMHDVPAALHSLHDQPEQSMRLLSIGHGELPFSSDHRGASAEQINVQVLKLELAHLFCPGPDSVAGSAVTSVPILSSLWPRKRRSGQASSSILS